MSRHHSPSPTTRVNPAVAAPVPLGRAATDAARPGDETFTGRSLEDMTLAQKICELREDRLRLLGLEQGFWANVKLVGVGFGLKRAWQRQRLRRQGELDAVIADYGRQVDDDIAAIEHDELARGPGGYRGQSLTADVQRVIERFGREPDPHALADLRRFVKIHQQELAREIRRLQLDQQHPSAGVGRLAARVLDLLFDHRKLLLIGGTALVLGILGWSIAYSVVQHRNRNRPTFTLAAGIESTHPGVMAAAWGHDAAMRANRLVNVYLSAELGNDGTVLTSLCDDLASTLERSERAIDSAQSYYARGRSVGVRIAREGAGQFTGWSHSEHETGHTEEHCTTSTNSDGEQEEQCTTTYVCDYIDHQWRLQPDIVRMGVAALEDLAPDIAPVAPGWADVLTLRQQLRQHVEASPEHAEATTKARQELLARTDDWLAGLTVAGNDELVERLRYFRDGFVPQGELRWIADHVDDRTSFPLSATDRDYSCGGGRPPLGYSRCQRVASEAKALDERQTELAGALRRASTASRRTAEVLGPIRQGLDQGRDPDDFDQPVAEIGELAVRLQSALNPKSHYRPLTRVWRIAIPLLIFVGLSLLGALGGWGVVRALDRRRYLQRMVRRGIY